MLRAALILTCVLILSPLSARAESYPEGLSPDGPGPELRDTTRLDVERLPPEALGPTQLTRDLFARGLFVEAQLGGVAYVGDASSDVRAGPRFAIALGYELTRWFALLVQAEGSLHETRNRPPPRRTAFALAGAALGARFTVPLGVQSALWLEGLLGAAWSSGDVLRALGYADAAKIGLGYGGELGFDWHLRARHHSFGLLGGVRDVPMLARDGYTLAAYGAAYLRYVF